MKASDRRITELKNRISEVTPKQALELTDEGYILLDVRDADEVAQGSPKNALRMGRSFLELNIENEVPDLNHPILVLCASGMRSLFAAETLLNLGYDSVRSVAGGFNRWKNEGLPFEMPPVLNADARERYSRHLLMPNVGEKGQLKLMSSKVLCIGAGGIGSPAAMYLAAAGVGTLGLVDHDVVDRSNLQRQILHNESTVGIPKVESAKKTLTALNPSINVVTHQTHLEASNIQSLFEQYDVIVDGSDNIPTRYLVNDACVHLNKPNVHGAVFRFEGQLTVFWPGHPEHKGPCYRCMFPNSAAQNVLSCAQAGVLGVLPGVIGLMQAVEAVKIVLGIGRPLVGRMLYYDALEADFRQMKMKPKPDCPVCGENRVFSGFQDYQQQFCESPPQ